MLPPKKTKRNSDRTLKLQLRFPQKPFEDCNSQSRAPATEGVVCDASPPTTCSKVDTETGRDDSGTIGGFFKHLNRSSRISILNPTAAARLVRSRMSADQEELWVLALSSSKKLIGFEMIFRGTVDSCLVHPRDIIRFLCESNAASYIVAHNHPSGDVEPSKQDWSFTRRLVGCGDLIEIPLLDHLIVTLKGHTSMASMQPTVFERQRPTTEPDPIRTRRDGELR